MFKEVGDQNEKKKKVSKLSKYEKPGTYPGIKALMVMRKQAIGLSSQLSSQ